MSKKSKAARQKAFIARRKLGRNNTLYDLPWSAIHLTTGVVFGWIMTPFVALLLMVLWEPFENLVLSPILARYYIDFGYETVKNSMSDIVFDAVGVSIGYYLLLHFFQPPFHLF